MDAVLERLRRRCRESIPPLYEFACHEQNYGLINVVTGSQISEGSRQAQ